MNACGRLPAAKSKLENRRKNSVCRTKAEAQKIIEVKQTKKQWKQEENLSAAELPTARRSRRPKRRCARVGDLLLNADREDADCRRRLPCAHTRAPLSRSLSLSKERTCRAGIWCPPLLSLAIFSQKETLDPADFFVIRSLIGKPFGAHSPSKVTTIFKKTFIF